MDTAESVKNYSISNISDGASNYSLRSSLGSRHSSSKSRYDDHVRILATLVPDEIIYRDTKTNLGTNMSGVLLFVDVSGFTDMCERYNSIGKGGPSKITQVLNSYIGAMVQEIMSHNGDVMKFSGDAFLALWKSNDDVSMSDVIHAAIDCALGIQRSHGTYKTEVDIILRVKIAVAAGAITFSVIGDSNFMVLGTTMMDVKNLGNLCQPGEILISSTVKMFLSVNEYICEDVHADGATHQKIISIGSEWTPSTISNQFELFDAFALTSTKKEKADLETESELVVIDDYNRPDYYSYMLRPSLDYAASKDLNEYLRKFIIPPVVKAIDLNEPLDFLTEMRQVVIVFINVIINQTNKMESLVKVCNSTYTIVCEMVVKGGGCVNKVSMFDKDLMFLVIFGLRGFKHTFEAQRALYCAQNIIVKLQNVPLVESASVGVCTGMTYCGVVGHQMRKEYTVIGRTVNKAARLMVKYPDIVSCDRQTFLQSQLQAKYFALQPARALKGFKNVGPIYKYYDKTSKVEAIEREMSKVAQYPLLDRQKEMELFFYFLMLKSCGTNSTILSIPWPFLSNIDLDFGYNMIVINGRERQGKTRLLQEIIFYINESLSYNIVTFAWGDTNKPYRLFRTLFAEKIGITDSYNDKNINERTEKVKQFLYPFKVPEFLCALNDILGVNFEETKYYLRLTDEQKLYVKRKMIKYLCIKGFKDKGLLLIDNMEFMDEKTWSLFKVLLNIEWMFICATMGNYGLAGYEAKKIINRSDVKVLKLEPVEKLFHAGLICQDLNVMGVSLELERYIQVHSRGNPGWIESFLTTLCDSDVVKIKEMDKFDAHNQGFVMPPYDMVSRNIEMGKMASSTFQVDTKDSSFTQLFYIDIEDWEIIHQTIKDDQNLSKNIPPIVQICDLPKKINLEDMDNEDILDVNMIQTYDSLKVQEQLLLKCSSILGDSFSRVMLEYIMQSQSIIKNAEAIQKLFEIRVFSCGRAKYTNGAIQVDHYLTDPNEDTNIACYCQGFPTNPITFFLPSYANCGFIRFREPMFRQMLINLLTESQANLYHVRSMWFLESQTKRCLDCGLGYFTNLIGQSNDDGMKKYSMEHSSSIIRLRTPQPSFSQVNFGFKSGTSLDSPKIKGSMLELGANSIRDLKITRIIPAVEKTTNIGIVTDVHVRTFADNNLNDCECMNVLFTMYKHMINHCQEAGINEKLMFALLEYATLCIKNQNITIGFTLLEHATELLHRKLKYEFLEPNWQVPLTKGKIMLLKGQLHIQRSAFAEAEVCLLAALKCYNLKFPTNKLSIHTKTWTNELKQKIIVEYFPHKYIGSRNEDICMLAEQTSEVMSSLFMLYRRKLHFDKAYLASIWGMNEALRSDSNFAVMCHAYANLLTMNLIYSKIDFIPKLEDMALSMCYRKHTRLERHELEAVSKLYGAIFCRKCLCNNVMESLKLGSIVVQLNSPQFGGSSRWLMLPLMLRALIYTYLIAQAALLVQKMSYYKVTTQTHFAPMMYYTLCLEFRMYTTYSIEPFSYIKKHRVVKLQDFPKRVLTAIEMRYHVDLWLWYVKQREWEQATALFEHIKVVGEWPYNLEPAMYNVFVHLLEGFLLVIVRKLETCDQEGIKQPIHYTKTLILRLDKMTHRLECIRSRYLLLKAYWYIINKKVKKAFKTLDQASSYAKKCGVLYDIDWIEWTRQLWLQRNSTFTREDRWIKATRQEILVPDWEAHDSNEKPIPFYSFYPPKI